eukprot:CAMPEP_0167778446 /NCGR_PEP_ID=MMETSP0111_2-20121227/4255_1 /TAXON_ID=91324 /ORGANISM="Lotharella globosa, Strain CCCM811" /LENGTH=263 /DNA_ID=CAMNT_0007668745 /DNA_START=416 /DNA_END=1207 /DNA_ORIENTATION=+
MRQESAQCRVVCEFCGESIKATKSTTNGTVAKDLSSINRHFLNTCKGVPLHLQACLEHMRNIKGKRKKLMMGDILKDDFIKSVLSDESSQRIPNFHEHVKVIQGIVRKYIEKARGIFQDWDENRKRKAAYLVAGMEKKTRQSDEQMMERAGTRKSQWTLIYRLVMGKTKPGYIARRLRVLLPATINWIRDGDEGKRGTSSTGAQQYLFNIHIQAGNSESRVPSRLKGLIEFFFHEDNKSHYNLQSVDCIQFVEVRCPESNVQY